MPKTTTAAAIEASRFREVLGHYPTGVALITGMVNGEPIGMVVGTFTSVSIDPPLIAFLPMKTSRSFEALRTVNSFTVNILAHDQEDLCRGFARPAQNKFQRVSWTPSSNGSPVIDGAVASIDCDFHAILAGGDHHIVLGAVTSLEVHRPVVPLLFFQGGYGGFVPRSLMVPYDKELAASVTLAQELRHSTEVLAEFTGAEVTTYARVGNDVATVATVAGPGIDAVSVLGARFPLMPPLGEMFVAWEPEAEVEAWLGRAFGIDEDAKQFFRARLAATRERGWALNLGGTESEQQLFEAMRLYNSDDLTPANQRKVVSSLLRATERYQDIEWVPGQTYGIGSIVAPVWGDANQVQLVLRLSQLPPVSDQEQVLHWARALMAAANEASARIAARS
ncbi:MAG: flavin reductase [Arthrobacter sp.]